MNIAIILAGGIGSRMGADIPKQFIKVMNKPILAYTIDIFQKNQNIDAIEIVCHTDWKHETESIIRKYSFNKVKWLTDGGNTFQESTMNGIFNLEDKISRKDNVVISFGVSPMTTDEIINDSIRVCNKYGNGIASQDMVLCTAIKDNEYSTIQNINRESLVGFSNPWTFNYGELLDVYQEAINLEILNTIEPHTTSLYLSLGKRIYFSTTTSSNIKITTKEDLDIFEGHLLLQEKRKYL